MKLNVDKAIEELKYKTDEDIEYETAIKWSERAAAAYKMSTDSDNVGEKIRYLLWAEDLRHEAIEHAALIGDNGSTLNELQTDIDEYRNTAMKSVVTSLSQGEV